ncbi:MAG: ECF-type sigma factor [Thiohalomonadales bacterium]
MKKQGKLNVLLPKILTGERMAIVKAENIFYEHLKRQSLNLQPPKHKRQVTHIPHLLRESLPLDEMKLTDKERAHLLAIAASQIRRVVSELKSQDEKNQSNETMTVDTLLDNSLSDADQVVDFITVDKYLQALTKLDQKKASLFEMAYFGGMNYEEMAETVAMNIAGVDRELRFARAWLCKQISDPQ